MISFHHMVSMVIKSFMTSRIKTARIWALRLGFGPRHWDLKGRDGGEEEGGGGEEEGGGENLQMCESIGHRPCPAPPQLQPQPT